ncbi:MAG: NAD(P)-binding domain-containing protein [Candidatus Eisenbacteria bacterium]
MPNPARNTLAIIGAGPIGLESAALALELGLDAHVFERGEVGAHAIAWGHVRMFTPWRMNLGAASVRLLEKNGWTAPDPEIHPTGAELAEQYLQPLARCPELRDRLHEHAQVVHISRKGALKGDLVGDPGRAEHPFRLLVRDMGGRENYLHTYAVIDASGVYGTPNWAGSGGIPARGELYLAPQMSYHLDDVRGLRRERHAGKRTLVLGGGASAVTSVLELARLAAEEPGTTVLWAMRRREPRFAGEAMDDTLPLRAASYAEAGRLAAGANPSVTWAGGVEVEGFEFNSATHRYRVSLTDGDQARLEEVDQVMVNCGFGPDNSIYRELQIHECYGSRGPMNLSAALLGAGGAATDCTKVPAFGAQALKTPEPDFYILGAKSYARYNSFLLQTGFAQVSAVLPLLTPERSVGTPA